MAYGVSNGHVTDDVTWPRKVKLVVPIPLERNISKTAGDAIQQQSLIRGLLDLLWGSSVGYPSDSLASCTTTRCYNCSVACSLSGDVSVYGIRRMLSTNRNCVTKCGQLIDVVVWYRDKTARSVTDPSSCLSSFTERLTWRSARCYNCTEINQFRYCC